MSQAGLLTVDLESPYGELDGIDRPPRDCGYAVVGMTTFATDLWAQ
jgi:hypothetical protein